MTSQDPLFIKICSDVDRLLAAGAAQTKALDLCLSTFSFFVEHGYVTDLAVKCLGEVGTILIEVGEQNLGQKPSLPTLNSTR